MPYTASQIEAYIASKSQAQIERLQKTHIKHVAKLSADGYGNEHPAVQHSALVLSAIDDRLAA